ncbi:MlaD family protein [Gordonia sputi]
MRNASSATKRLLLVAAVVILALYAIVQAINRPVGGDVETYRAEFSDVFGLHKNADVRVRGVQVGKVTGIDLQSTGVALVTFTVREENRLTNRDQLAIRFQNLVGQRYLAVTKAEVAEKSEVTEKSGVAGAASSSTSTDVTPLDPDQVIPAAKTSGSFDITKLFNGLRPLLQGADPEVFNTFATNMLHLLQGEDGVGLGDVLADVERLTRFATDKKALISTIVNNLGVISTALQGKSEIIAVLMKGLGVLFDTLETKLDLLKSAFGNGAKVFPPIVDLLSNLFDLTLGGHDNVSARIMQLVPDTNQFAEVLGALPTFLATVNASMSHLGFDATCSRGEVSLPEMGQVLLGGGKVTLCRA